MYKKIVIGIDPDSKKHGIAAYRDGVLFDLHCLDLSDSVDFVKYCKKISDSVLVNIEDVNSNNFLYSRNVTGNHRVDASKLMSVAKCQQAQIELIRVLEKIPDIRIFKTKPMRGNWAKNKKQFEKVTGWKNRSNEDTRSAAFFGYIILNKKIDSVRYGG